MGAGHEDFEPWLALWNLVPEGDVMSMPVTRSRLLPVRAGYQAAMLKLAHSPDERRGGSIMAWWGGQGAAPVLAAQDEALLMLRAAGGPLTQAVSALGDEAATAILCEVIARLHAPRSAPPPTKPLATLFDALITASDPTLADARDVALRLLGTQGDEVLLHGDMHHSNVLEFGAAGWLAIDPWGVWGERAYDYANIFRNPDLGWITPDRFAARLAQIAGAADLEPARLTAWAYAHAGLSVAWDAQDGTDSAASRALMAIIEGLS